MQKLYEFLFLQLPFLCSFFFFVASLGSMHARFLYFQNNKENLSTIPEYFEAAHILNQMYTALIFKTFSSFPDSKSVKQGFVASQQQPKPRIRNEAAGNNMSHGNVGKLGILLQGKPLSINSERNRCG